jgi:hypothetical protein
MIVKVYIEFCQTQILQIIGEKYRDWD